MLRNILFLLILLPALAFSCRAAQAEPKLMSRHTDAYFSTVSALFLYEEPENTDRFAETWTQVKSLLQEIEQTVSLSFEDSDISRFNALPSGESMQISPITADILSVAFDVHAKTGGLYDPTVYPLIDLWGFSPRFNRNTYAPVMPYDRAYQDGRLPLPEDSDVQALRPLVGLDGIRLYALDDGWYLEKNTPSITLDGVVIPAQLDLGGIAKGYACDRVRACLLEQGYTMGHFVCGDSSMAILSRPSEDGMYALTLGKPRPGSSRDSHYASLRVRDTALSTSSDATHAYTAGGVRYCHIIDPRTGYPMNMPQDAIQHGAASVTLLCESAAFGDAMSTALCLMPPEQAAAYISERLADTLCTIVYYRSDADTLEVMTSAPNLTLNDDDYLLSSQTDSSGTLRYTGSFFSP